MLDINRMALVAYCVGVFKSFVGTCVVLTFILMTVALGWADTANGGLVAESRDEKAPERNNVIWILLDGCRPNNLGCFGYERNTSPTLDRLAAEGTLFLSHFSQASKTYNSVPSYMTGRYFPVACFSKRYSQTVLDVIPPAEEMMIGEIMRANGYQSAMFSNMPLFQEEDRLSRSFDQVFLWRQGQEVLLQRWEVMKEKLYSWLESKKDVPFFLYIHAADTHFPHELVAPYDKWIPKEYNPDILLPVGYGQNYRRRDNEMYRNEDKEYLNAVYDGMILDADNQISGLLEKVQALGLRRKTVVVISADHGQLIGEDGYNVAHMGGTDEVLHIPFIMQGPGVAAGKRIDHLTENVDIVPTLVALLSLETGARFDGYNLVSVMNGTVTGGVRDYTFAVPDRSEYENPTTFLIRTREAKFEFSPSGDLRQVFQVPDSAASRVDITETCREQGEAMKGLMQKRFLPLLRAMQALPVKAVVLEGAWLANRIEPRELVVDHYVSGEAVTADLEKDNKWAYSDGMLWARNGAETVSEVSFQVSMPDGTYEVEARLYNCEDYNGTPASSLNLKFDHEAKTRQITCVSLPRAEGAVTTVPLGAVTVAGGNLKFTLKGGEPGYWTMISSIKLVPVNAAGSQEDEEEVPAEVSPGKDSEYHELMRGLGYM